MALLCLVHFSFRPFGALRGDRCLMDQIVRRECKEHLNIMQTEVVKCILSVPLRDLYHVSCWEPYLTPISPYSVWRIQVRTTLLCPVFLKNCDEDSIGKMGLPVLQQNAVVVIDQDQVPILRKSSRLCNTNLVIEK